ncbi:aromatic ring-hydroxylating oxygenase subunit alpha [Leptothoe kymatousa]|uniref:Aromatic ring-hydroxylating dioxygenase subunit alpha n=1 Tax=Leptothoe kymatousa TAU-MAC 1615 TaxID=2364775 RepID=A0ABS5Y6T4_9CYAN|nr:aromatic ring-hydroxylating dioxygenase subunit alpha [Leptothoe kymatousa]MBT9313533.1 aromatic ring-hydroxylating dioxygenase subunit alpha [Leptothoe kymatousa TAU-MAC 1615]
MLAEQQPSPQLVNQRDLPAHFLLRADHYTNPAWLPIEKKHIFQKTWLYIGDSAQLAVGQVWAKQVVGQPVVITCLGPGEFKAFHNVCPHRASLLCNQTGIHSQKHLVCPYHAWVYDLHGNLVGAPAQPKFSDTFKPENYPLSPIRLESWSGFLFICFSDDAPSLHDFLGSIPQHLGHHRRGQTRLLLSQRQVVNCNWKNFHDNTLCDYHVAIAHRHTLHKVQGPIKHYSHHLETYTNCLRTPVTPDWQAENTALPDLPKLSQTAFFTYGIFPNLHLLGLPNGMLAWLYIAPLTSNTCELRSEVYGIPELSPSIATLKADFDAFTSEDIILTENVQKGYASGAYTPGPVNQLEARIVHQQQLILDFISQTSNPTH